MRSAEHALQLQFLLRKVHSKAASNDDPESNPDFTAANNFIRFVYFQCFPKIQPRLCVPVRPGGLPFKDLFCKGRIKVSELRSRFDKSAADDLVLDEKILRHGDEWIVEHWRSRFKGQEPELEECDHGKYLVHNADVAVGLHKIICGMFRRLSENLERVRSARLAHTQKVPVTADYLQSVEAALYGVDYYMVFLASLHQSPCFWKHLRHPAVQDWVLKEAGNKRDVTVKVCAHAVLVSIEQPLN